VCVCVCVCVSDTKRVTYLNTGQTGPALGCLGHCMVHATQHSQLALMVCCVIH